MNQRLILVRHGQSQANVDGVLESLGDSPLTETGHAQARALAAHLAQLDLAGVTVVASPLRRAAHTADQIAAALSTDLAYDHRLREGEVAGFEGVSFAEIEKKVSEAGKSYLDHELHGGEAPKEIAARVKEALAEVRASGAETIIFVMHGYSLRMLAWSLYEGREDGKFGETVANCDAFEILLGPDGPIGPLKRLAPAAASA